jgi:DNA-binding NarL/FixJ family response regulator
MLRRYSQQAAALPAVSDDVAVLEHDEHELEPRSITPPLTARQREIVALVSQGLSNKEVARRLNLTDGTVKIHLHRIYTRMRIRSRTALAAFALQSRSKHFVLVALAANAVLATLATAIVFFVST